MVSRNGKHISILIPSHWRSILSLSLVPSIDLHALTPLYVYFLPFQLPSLVHPSLLPLLPPSLCQLAHVNFAFPHCFSRGKCLCFWLSPGPRFNTITPLIHLLLLLLLLLPLLLNTHTLYQHHTSCIALLLSSAAVWLLEPEYDWLPPVYVSLCAVINSERFPVISAQLCIDIQTHTQRHTQVLVWEVDCSGTCLPAVCCPLGGFQPSDWQVRRPGAESHNTAGLAQMPRRDKNPLSVHVCIFLWLPHYPPPPLYNFWISTGPFWDVLEKLL